MSSIQPSDNLTKSSTTIDNTRIVSNISSTEDLKIIERNILEWQSLYQEAEIFERVTISNQPEKSLELENLKNRLQQRLNKMNKAE